MPNANYLSGVRFERKMMRTLNDHGFLAMRTAGSHGPFDVIAIRDDQPVIVMQCKRVQTEAEARNLALKWLASPPLKANEFMAQHLAIYVVKTREILEYSL